MAFIRKSPSEKGWSELEQIAEQKHLGAEHPADWAMGAPHERNTFLRLSARS